MRLKKEERRTEECTVTKKLERWAYNLGPRHRISYATELKRMHKYLIEPWNRLHNHYEPFKTSGRLVVEGAALRLQSESV